MSKTATIGSKTMDSQNFEPGEDLEKHLESLTAQQLRELASYARKKAAGKEDPARKPGGKGGRWLEAQYVRGSGPYFHLRYYQPGEVTYRNASGRLISGKRKTKYVGRRLPADLAEEFGYPEGVTPEETDVTTTGTPREGSSRKRRSE